MIEFPDFNDRACEAIDSAGDSYPPWRDLQPLAEWPDHMARALDRIAEYEDGPRPWPAWVQLLREQMTEEGARL